MKSIVLTTLVVFPLVAGCNGAVPSMPAAKAASSSGSSPRAGRPVVPAGTSATEPDGAPLGDPSLGFTPPPPPLPFTFESSIVGELPDGRDGHAVVPLVAKGAAIFGGRSQKAAATDTIFIFFDGAITPSSAHLRTPRAGVSAIRLPSGEILVVGGRALDGQPLSSTEIYSPSTDRVRPGPELMIPRIAPFLAIEGSSVVAIGGAETIESASLETWSGGATFQFLGTRLSVPRQGARCLEVAPGQFLVHGGKAGATVAPTELVTLGTPKGAVLDFPGGVRDEVALCLTSSGVLLVGGGRDGKAVDEVDSFDGAALGVHGEKLAMPRRAAGVAAVSADLSLIVCGHDEVGSFTKTSVAVYAGHFYEGPELQVRRSDPTATKLEDGTVLVTGGESMSDGPIAQCELVAVR